MNVSHSHLLSFPRRIRLPSHRRGQCEGASAAEGSIWLAELRRQSGLIRASTIDAADLSGADQLYLVGLHHSFRQKALRRVGHGCRQVFVGKEFRGPLKAPDRDQGDIGLARFVCKRPRCPRVSSPRHDQRRPRRPLRTHGRLGPFRQDVRYLTQAQRRPCSNESVPCRRPQTISTTLAGIKTVVCA